MAFIAVDVPHVPVAKPARAGRHWPQALSGWLKLRRDERALQVAAERLDALSPHLLADIGLEYGPVQED